MPHEKDRIKWWQINRLKKKIRPRWGMGDIIGSPAWGIGI